MSEIVDKKQDILLETGTNEVEIAEFGIYLKDSKICQSFGINVAKVREIIKVPQFIQSPGMHKDVIGMFKLRDKIIPLINLGSWLNETAILDREKSIVIVTEFNENNFGFLVHKINTIHRMSWQRVLPPMNITTDIREDCITGVVLLDEKNIMMMMDFEKIVADINPESSLKMNADKEIIDSLNFSSTNPKVLLAEDSSIVRDLLAEILKKGGFEVVHVNNGQNAWENLEKWKKQATDNGESIKNQIELVVSDIEMPQMDGHSLTRKIKEDPVLKDIPVILFSSLIYDEMRRKGELIGADAQITKPEIGNLLSVVKKVLEKTK